ncbi:hypothetical protein VCHC55A1_0145, partial [Vibrio cholerae HC-55A1]
MGKPETSER